jgi:hypothetical protein
MTNQEFDPPRVRDSRGKGHPTAAPEETVSGFVEIALTDRLVEE